MAKRYDIRRVKMHRCYEVSEAADVLGITTQTVRKWIKDGLFVLTAKRPKLIPGEALRKYAQDLTSPKRLLPPGQFQCLRCKTARMPLGMMADYLPTDAHRGRLVALCGVCEATCSRFAKASDLPELSQILEIVTKHVNRA